MEEEIMDQQGLASLLEMSSGTVAKLVSVDPKRLPPFTNMGTVRRVIPRWRKTAVLAWLAEREVLPPLLVRMEPVILAPQKAWTSGQGGFMSRQVAINDQRFSAPRLG